MSVSFFLTTDFVIFLPSEESVYSYLNKHLEAMAKDPANLDQLTTSLHVWPDFHGNRSPLADPTLKGMVRGERICLTLLVMYHTYHKKLSVPIILSSYVSHISQEPLCSYYTF